MKQTVLISILLIFSSFQNALWAQTSSEKREVPLRVMSFNIRYDNPYDGEFSWEKRRVDVLDLILRYKPDIVGIQEALKNQIDFLERKLYDYSWVGAGREDGQDKGEFSAIFYLNTRFDVQESSTFWLSETPDEPGSKGWDAVCPRVITLANLKEKETGNNLFAFNTHFDHIGDSARVESARMLLDRLESITKQDRAVITGDFNFKPDSRPYLILMENKRLKDARRMTTNHEGPSYTYGDFPHNKKSKQLIDHIFIKNTNDFWVTRYKVVDDNRKGFYPSDHLPILVDIVYLDLIEKTEN